MNPPGDGTNSDEDDANDEMMDGLTLNNLPGRQLNAAAEAVVRLRDGTICTIFSCSNVSISYFHYITAD